MSSNDTFKRAKFIMNELGVNVDEFKVLVEIHEKPTKNINNQDVRDLLDLTEEHPLIAYPLILDSSPTKLRRLAESEHIHLSNRAGLVNLMLEISKECEKLLQSTACPIEASYTDILELAYAESNPNK